MIKKLPGPGAVAAALIAGLGGIALGIGTYTFVYAQGASYMTNDPAACANCHIMREQYDGWLHGSHRNVAVCNDCHAPHDFVGKYFTKALNGWNHSRAFTTGNFHEPIQVTPRNASITEAACRGCHGALTSAIEGPHAGGDPIRCASCHRDVGHMH